MKSNLDLREYAHLVIDPRGDDKEMKRLSGARVFMKNDRSQRLEPLLPKQQDALIDASLITSERNQSFPEDLVGKIEVRIQAMEASLGAEFLNLVRNGRLHILFILNAKCADDNAFESHLKLIKHIEKNGGFASAIGVDEVEADVAKLFIEAGNRYLAPDAQLRFSLSRKVSDPKFVYDGNSDYMFLSIQRAHEIGWLRTKLLGAVHPPSNMALRQRIDNIPLPLPDLSDIPEDYPIRFSTQEASDVALAQFVEDPIELVSDLFEIPAEELPQDIREALISKSKSTSGEIKD